MSIKDKIRPYILPSAILLSICFHQYLGYVSWLIPYLIFVILLLTFSSVRIRSLRPHPLDAWIAALQIIFALGGYGLLLWLTHNEILAQGILIAAICPVAASVSVISCALGANRQICVGYTIIGNLMVTLVAPVIFSFIGTQQSMPFVDSFFLILGRIASILAAPFFIALLLQIFLPEVNKKLAKFKDYSFYLWAMALLLTLGKTMDYIFTQGKGNERTILWLAVISLVLCAVHFIIGKLLGKHYGDVIAGGQLLAQKNSAMGIWMACLYLNPLSSVTMAFYSIWTNLFNSWQLWYYAKHPQNKM